jgi:hypothetical protein
MEASIYNRNYERIEVELNKGDTIKDLLEKANITLGWEDVVNDEFSSEKELNEEVYDGYEYRVVIKDWKEIEADKEYYKKQAKQGEINYHRLEEVEKKMKKILQLVKVVFVEDLKDDFNKILEEVDKETEREKEDEKRRKELEDNIRDNVYELLGCGCNYEPNNYD